MIAYVRLTTHVINTACAIRRVRRLNEKTATNHHVVAGAAIASLAIIAVSALCPPIGYTYCALSIAVEAKNFIDARKDTTTETLANANSYDGNIYDGETV